jgi:ABC-type polysaccharide/polyol phosphate transport system ATPase subunit
MGIPAFKFQEKCERRMDEIMFDGATVRIASHLLYQTRRLCKHAIWLEKGAMKMLGEVGKVCAAYRGIGRA